MQRVLLTIKGTQIEDGQSEFIEFVTEGLFSRTADGYLLEYEESELTGIEDCTTKLIIKEGSVTLQRSGRMGTHMIFSPGSVYESNFSTPYGTMHLSVFALRVESSLRSQDGSLCLEYELNMGELSTINKLDLSFKSMKDCIS